MKRSLSLALTLILLFNVSASSASTSLSPTEEYTLLKELLVTRSKKMKPSQRKNQVTAIVDRYAKTGTGGTDAGAPKRLLDAAIALDVLTPGQAQEARLELQSAIDHETAGLKDLDPSTATVVVDRIVDRVIGRASGSRFSSCAAAVTLSAGSTLGAVVLAVMLKRAKEGVSRDLGYVGVATLGVAAFAGFVWAAADNC